MQPTYDFHAKQYALEALYALRKVSEKFLPKEAIDLVFDGSFPPNTTVEKAQDIMQKAWHSGDFTSPLRMLVQARLNVVAERQKSKPVRAGTYNGQAIANMYAARRLVEPRLPRHKKTGAVIGMPTISCDLGMQSVIRDAGSGRVHLPIHWHKTVCAHGIAVCDWGVNLVLVVRARPQSSVFLADMGVSYFEVDGLRMGTSAKSVTGYAFCGAGYRPVFSQSFQTGVRAIKERVEQATLSNMGV